MTTATFWNPRPSANGRQIVFFPYLGGFGAAFNQLVGRLGDGWDVWTANPPGHGPSRLPLLDRLPALVEHYLRELPAVLRPGAVLYGHSMGGVVAWCVARAIELEGRLPLPSELVLSASRAPRDHGAIDWSHAGGPELRRHMLDFGAIPPLIADDPELLDSFLPVFRADYAVLEEARDVEPAPLGVPARLLLGELDHYTTADAANSWADYLRRPPLVHTLPGAGHMFVQDRPEAIARILEGVLATADAADRHREHRRETVGGGVA